MKILIVDDENLAIARLIRLLTELNFDDITSFSNPSEALLNIIKIRYDIVFLDIQMPSISGLELANKILDIEPSTFIVFQTAYEQFALDAFNNGGIDYILKPTTKENISKALETVNRYSQVSVEEKEKKIIGKSGDSIYPIKLDDIYYIKADLDEIIIKIQETQCYVRKKIGEMDNFLKQKNFFRIHRSIIVNVDKIKSMTSIEQSKLEICFSDIEDIVVSSKDGAKDFREYLERRSF
jgi:two-component system LytT family response regulator